MSDIRIIHLDETDSTNIYINKVEETNVLVAAEYQTAGRGQGSNTWESERGKNLLFSIKVSPSWMEAKDYYLLSMAGALALKNVLDSFVGDITLKWPNDIYWKDKKISGTLIQTSISGRNIQDCIYGVGININQRIFVSDAPNPVSLWQILGRETDREKILQMIADEFSRHLQMLEEGKADFIHQEYNKHLYRREGFYAYEDKDGMFEAEVIEVLKNGHLVLRDRNGMTRIYELKEVKFII